MVGRFTTIICSANQQNPYSWTPTGCHKIVKTFNHNIEERLLLLLDVQHKFRCTLSRKYFQAIIEATIL